VNFNTLSSYYPRYDDDDDDDDEFMNRGRAQRGSFVFCVKELMKELEIFLFEVIWQFSTVSLFPSLDDTIFLQHINSAEV